MNEITPNRLSLTIESFAAAGLDTRTTIGQAIDYFVAKNGFSLNHARLNFHEAMHIASNRLNGHLESEWHAAIYERVLCRGSYAHHNTTDLNDFSSPVIPSPSFEEAFEFADLQIHFINRNPSFDTGNQEDARISYNNAISLDRFFRQATGGQALYQLSSSTLRALPLAFLGVQAGSDFLVSGFEPIKHSIQQNPSIDLHPV